MSDKILFLRFVELWKSLLSSRTLEITQEDGYNTSIFTLRDEKSKKVLNLTYVNISKKALCLEYGGMKEAVHDDEVVKYQSLIELTKVMFEQCVINCLEEEIKERKN